jgi:hypothetical protein
MIRQPTALGPDARTEERSMRVIEYAVALVAFVAAGILALVR